MPFHELLIQEKKPGSTICCALSASIKHFTSLLGKEGGSLRATYLVIKMDALMFCWRTEVRDRRTHTRPDEQAQFISDVHPQVEVAQSPLYAWCSEVCLAYRHRIPHRPLLTNGHMKHSCVLQSHHRGLLHSKKSTAPGCALPLLALTTGVH